MANLTFENPIIPGFNPDPSVVRVNNDFFLITSTFEYFPGIPIYHSTDLLNWKLIGHVLTRSSQLNMRTVEPSAGIWASTIRFHGGRFYVTTAKWDRYRPQNDERIFPRGFYVSTDNIWDTSSWSDPVYFDNPGFDQDLFWDDDGRVYLSTTVRVADRAPESKLKDFAIHVSEIDLETGRTLTAPKVIRASPHGIAEGSHIIKRNKFYYLFTAEGGTEAGHQEWVLRSENGPFGPWILGPKNPLWYNGTDQEVQSTGHADVFEDSEGNWWAVLLAVRPRQVSNSWIDSQLGRETFLVTVEWEDDWPVFNNGNKISLVTEGRNGQQLVPSSLWKADFNKRDLDLGWYQKNTPLKKEWSLTARPGYLRIHGGCYDLSSPECPTMLLRKQVHFRQTFHAALDFNPKKEGYEAGIVLWWSVYSYASIGVRILSPGTKSEKKIIIVKTPTRDIGVMQEHTHQISTGEVDLSIEGDDLGYRLSYTQPGTSITQVFGHVESHFLTRSPPLGGAFTGVMFGLYSMGKGEPCLDPADFFNVSLA